MKNRNQWFNEGQPVMRHLRDFEIENNDKPAYCLFIAPEIHRDTINTFWQSIKYEYEGEKQKIVPLTIKQFIRLLEILGSLLDKEIKIASLNFSTSLKDDDVIGPIITFAPASIISLIAWFNFSLSSDPLSLGIMIIFLLPISSRAS